MNTADFFSYGRPQGSFYVEFMRRSEPYTMTSNHYHPYYELYYLLRGEREYFIRDTSYSIREGDLVLIDKNELHKTLHAGKDAHERFIVHFDDRFVHGISSAHAAFLLQPFQQNRPVLRLPEPDKSAMHHVIVRMLQEMQEQSSGFELCLAHGVTQLLLAAARFLQKHEPGSARNDSPMHLRISEIVRYLNSHFAEQVTLNRLAEEFAISPFYLSRMFKEVTGFTLTDYLNVKRIKEASRLLGETDMKIIDIAAAVGFENFSHFGKTFKRIAQATPRAYRKHYRGIPADF